MKTYLALLCTAMIVAASTATACEYSPDKEKPTANSRRAAEAAKVKKQIKSQQKSTQNREAAAIAFVRRHHPELASLLATLKKTDAKQYKRAINALFAAGQHLEDVRQRSTERYERELREWKLRSRIQLLVAQIRMAPDNVALQQALRQALADQLELRHTRMIEERNKLANRLEKLDRQLEELKEDRGALVDKQMEMLLRTRKKHAAKENHPRDAQPGDASSRTVP